MLIKGAAALVTGAGAGLGRGLAERLLRAGARVSYFHIIRNQRRINLYVSEETQQ